MEKLNSVQECPNRLFNDIKHFLKILSDLKQECQIKKKYKNEYNIL